MKYGIKSIEEITVKDHTYFRITDPSPWTGITTTGISADYNKLKEIEKRLDALEEQITTKENIEDKWVKVYGV